MRLPPMNDLRSRGGAPRRLALIMPLGCHGTLTPYACAANVRAQWPGRANARAAEARSSTPLSHDGVGYRHLMT